MKELYGIIYANMKNQMYFMKRFKVFSTQLPEFLLLYCSYCSRSVLEMLKNDFVDNFLNSMRIALLIFSLFILCPFE